MWASRGWNQAQAVEGCDQFRARRNRIELQKRRFIEHVFILHEGYDKTMLTNHL